MNKDYKLMASLIPIILVLSIALYLFPDASGLKTDITAPIINQTDNSSLNESSINSAPETQNDTLGNQNTQDSSDYYNPPDNTDTGSNTDNNTNEPTDTTNSTP
jgi:hypothetical protein